MYKNIKKLIKNKKINIGIFGLGYVGLPLALRFADKKFNVYGYDSNKRKISTLQRGKSYIKQISSDIIKTHINNKFYVFDNFNNVENLHVLIFCLPTPLKKNKNPNLTFLKTCLEKIEKKIRKGQIFIHESTSYPGTTEEYFEKIFKRKNFKIGKDCYLVFSPEREDPGNKIFNIKNITKVVSGKTSKCLSLGEQLYKMIVNKVFKVKDIKTAEMTKLVENIFRSVNIGLVNEMKIICERLGIDIWDVIEAAKSKPFGFYPFSPGPGVGGHCIPVDPIILSWKAKNNIDTKFIDLASKINDLMPNYVAKKLIAQLKKFHQNKNKVCLIGVAYKPDVDDYREAPSSKIINILKVKYDIDVEYCDPLIPIMDATTQNPYKLKSIKLNYNSLKNYDAVLIITNHKLFDYKKIYKYSKLIIDTRGVYKKDKLGKVIKA